MKITKKKKTAKKGPNKNAKALVKEINDALGLERAIYMFGDQDDNVSVRPTQFENLNAALGIGGMPRGRIVEIFGPESSGKTTLALHMLRDGQKAGELVAMIDAEGALDPGWAKTIGVNLEELYFSQPSSAEEALDLMVALAESGKFGVILLDSIAAMAPQAELDGEMGDQQMGVQARLLSKAMRKLQSALNKHPTCTVILLNQVRSKIGVRFGSPETTPGGRAVPFAASIRMRIGKIESVRKRGQEGAIVSKIRVIKNKLARPFREAELSTEGFQGFNQYLALIDMAEDYGVITRAKKTYMFGKKKLAVGDTKLVEYLRSHPKVRGAIRKKVRAKWQKSGIN